MKDFDLNTVLQMLRSSWRYVVVISVLLSYLVVKAHGLELLFISLGLIHTLLDRGHLHIYPEWYARSTAYSRPVCSCVSRCSVDLRWFQPSQLRRRRNAVPRGRRPTCDPHFHGSRGSPFCFLLTPCISINPLPCLGLVLHKRGMLLCHGHVYVAPEVYPRL